MDIFESLENLSVSEECFEDIMSIVEGLLNESLLDTSKKLYNKYIKKDTFDTIKDAERIADQNVADTKSVRRHVNKQYKRNGSDKNIDYEQVYDNVKNAVKDREELHKLDIPKNGFSLNPLTDKARKEKERAGDYKTKEPSEENKRYYRLARKAEKAFKSVKRPHEKSNKQEVQRAIQLTRNRHNGVYNNINDWG